MFEPKPNSFREPDRPDGWELVCTGILRSEFGRRPSRAVSKAIMQLTAEEAMRRHQALTPSWRERMRNWWRRLSSREEMAFALALLLAAGLAIWFVRSGRLHGRASTAHSAVCEVTDALNAHWAGGSKSPKVGDVLKPGTLHLESGVVELKFVSSAKVAVEGPAEFSLTGWNSMKLQTGKISTEVPGRAHGFSVITPTATVVDLGTRFGASVNSDQASEVDVFQGHVELSVPRNTGNPGGQWRLGRNMAMIADTHGAIAVTALSEKAFPQPALTISDRPQNCGFDVLGRAVQGEVPDHFGYWSGPAYRLTGTIQNIQPPSGRGMLQFLDNPAGPDADSAVWQLIDLHGYRRLLAGGQVRAQLCALFNRTAVGASVSGKFGLTLAAFHGRSDDAPSLWRRRDTAALALADKELTADDNSGTWEKLEVTAGLPAETDFIIIELRAIAPKQGTGNAPVFPGSFADLVKLGLCTPLQPSSISISR